MPILTWFLGTTVGRYALSAVTGLVAVSVVLLRVFAAGKTAERVKQANKTLTNLQTREKVDEDTAKASGRDARDELAGWVRRDDK